MKPLYTHRKKLSITFFCDERLQNAAKINAVQRVSFLSYRGRVRARIFFSFAITFANLIFLVPISLNLGHLSPMMKVISCNHST